MTIFLVSVVLVFSIGLMLFATPLILYVAPFVILGIGFSLARDTIKNRARIAEVSERRMSAMLRREGVKPAVTWKRDNVVHMKQARHRCRNCQFGQLCDSWLAGDANGDNSFCPNARLFEVLKETDRAA